MALKKKHITAKGIPVEYWRIDRMNFDYERNKTVGTLCGYAEKQYREADLTNFVRTIAFEFKGKVDVGRPEAYGLLKNKESIINKDFDFSDAEDV